MATIIDTLITDRTQADWEYAAEISRRIRDETYWALPPELRAEIESGLRGMYSHTDAARVEAAAAFVATALNSYGYDVSVPIRPGGWTLGDMPTVDDWTALFESVRRIAVAIPLQSPPPLPEVWDGLTIITANNIERTLIDADAAARMIGASFVYAGLVNSGEPHTAVGIWTEPAEWISVTVGSAGIALGAATIEKSYFRIYYLTGQGIGIGAGTKKIISISYRYAGQGYAGKGGGGKWRLLA